MTDTDNNPLIVVLLQARDALATCYDVLSYPSDGTTDQDKAIAEIDNVLGRTHGPAYKVRRATKVEFLTIVDPVMLLDRTDILVIEAEPDDIEIAPTANKANLHAEYWKQYRGWVIQRKGPQDA